MLKCVHENYRVTWDHFCVMECGQKVKQNAESIFFVSENGIFLRKEGTSVIMYALVYLFSWFVFVNVITMDLFVLCGASSTTSFRNSLVSFAITLSLSLSLSLCPSICSTSNQVSTVNISWNFVSILRKVVKNRTSCAFLSIHVHLLSHSSLCCAESRV